MAITTETTAEAIIAAELIIAGWSEDAIQDYLAGLAD